jgi:shikimate dehydrogenase
MAPENAVFQIDSGGGLYVTGALARSAGWPRSPARSQSGIDSGPALPDGTAMNATARPPAACLIGWPAAHSRSPLIHHYWLRQLGIEGGYSIEAVPPEEFAEFAMHLAHHGFVGANVTIPHKERALALTNADARARAVGAANTLWYEGGELRSTNTDVEGFINNLDASAPGWDAAGEALVLGAGGSSRAVLFGLLERGIKRIHLANRTVERSRALADQFGARVEPVAWDGIAGLMPRADLLVNTTSLGMHGQPALGIDVAGLPQTAVVADLVYVPLKTPLLAAAQARGLRVADGLGMLLHQAVRGFELWFGRRPEVTPELRALVEADLGHG